MADFSIHTRSPDAGHEAIRVAVVDAIENLDVARGDVEFSFDLVDTLFSLLDNAIGQLVDAAAEQADLVARLSTLEGRVVALEGPTDPGA